MADLTFNAGRLRHRISIQQRSEVQDQGTGDVTYQWVDVATKVACEISPASAKEFIAASAMQSEIVAKIVLRYRGDVTAKMRAVHVKQGIEVLYNIEGVLADPKSGLEWMTLPCSQGINDG
jgi:SPP1 family predicted phage head-tail adaptor